MSESFSATTLFPSFLGIEISSASQFLLMSASRCSRCLILTTTGSPEVTFFNSSRLRLIFFRTLNFGVFISRTTLALYMRFLKAVLPIMTSISDPSCEIVKPLTVTPGVKTLRINSSVIGWPMYSSKFSSGLSRHTRMSPAKFSSATLMRLSLSLRISCSILATSSSQIISPATNDVSPSSMTRTLLSGATFRSMTSMCLLFMLTP